MVLLDWSQQFQHLGDFMFNEYDVVKSNKELSAKVPKGTLGAILIVYEANPPAYEVEFVDEAGNSLDVLTVLGADIYLFPRSER